MDVAAGAIGSLLPKLGELLKEECKLQKGVKDDIEFIAMELQMARPLLSKVAEAPRVQLDVQVRFWADELRELSYSLDASVDTFLMSVVGSERADNPGSFKSFVKKMANLFRKGKAYRQFADLISDMKDHVCDLRARRDRYRIDVGARHKATITVDPRALLLHRDQKELVGIEGARDEIIKMLCEGDDVSIQQELKMVSISGFGGFGKTTLAKAVYDSLQEQFDCRAFVSVGQKPDVKEVCRAILFGLDEQKYMGFDASRYEMGDVIHELRTLLKNRRYLIVVDDIWDMRTWTFINCAFIRDSKGSAVLMTTRIMNVAHYAHDVYRVAPLSKLHSKELFYQTLYGSSDYNCPPDLSDISEKIIEKCSGMPLAIINTAGLLKGKPLDDWYAVHDSIYLDDSYDMRKILALSYTDLPSHLKSCLLYLSMFHKGCEISVDCLVLGWIAEGFIGEVGGKTSREIGEHYLSELINRNLIIPVDFDASGKALSCCVYNIVHDLISSLSAEEKFTTVLDMLQGRSLPETVHRLSIQGKNVEDQIFAQVPLSHVRSLFVSGGANLLPCLSEFKNLRVLNFAGCNSLQNDHLKGIESLLHLRCLMVGRNSITAIPKDVGNLVLLQILDLRASNVKELPESIVHARKFKCLRVNSCTKIPDGVVKMEGLEELADINISKPELLKELCRLSKLIVLGIAIWSWNGSYDAVLLEWLRSLHMENRRIRSLSILTCSSLHFLDELGDQWRPPCLQNLEIRHSTFLTLPIWIRSLGNLSSLSIEVYKLSQEIIGTLAELPNLLVLSLASKHAPEERFGNCTNNALAQLKSFQFVSNAMGKIFESGAMPGLKRIKLSFQASRTKDLFQGFDFGLGNLSSLEHVCVEINCFNANLGVVEEAETAIRGAIYSGCSRRPNLEIHRVRQEYMVENGKEKDDMIQNEENVVIKQRDQKETKKLRKIRVATKKLRLQGKGTTTNYKISGTLTLEAL